MSSRFLRGLTDLTISIIARTSRDALVRRLVKALAAQDTADMRATALSAREFADRVYPSSPVGPAGDTTTQRWFGSIIERNGRFKFVSYANQF